MRRRIFLILWFPILLGSGGVLLSGRVDLPEPAGLREANEAYLEDAFDRALAGFGVMSGFKAGLAVVEGSTGGVSAGVSLQLQVGDIVQAAYDYVDVAWRTLLAGCICLLSLQYLLEAAAWLDGLLAGGLLLVCGLRTLAGLRTSGPGELGCRLSDAAMALGFLLLALMVVLPASVWLSSRLSAEITAAPLAQAQQGYAATTAELFPEAEALPEGLLARVKAVPERLEAIALTLKARSQELGLWTVQLIAGYLFDCLVFPLGSFLLLLWGTRSLAGYCRRTRVWGQLRREIRGLRSSRGV